MSIKKFIPCIYLYQKCAVAGFEDPSRILSEDPVALAKRYSDNGADELLIFDLSTGDQEHEQALDVIKAICYAVEVPVIGAGNVKRMEDIKKLIYAGCKKAALNYSKTSNIEITQEVSQKFGKDKIVACVADKADVTAQKELLKAYVSQLVSVKEQGLEELLACSPLPLIAMLPQMPEENLYSVLKNQQLCGITGGAVNESAEEIQLLKAACAENGISVITFETDVKWEDFKLNSDNMVPVIVQDYKTDEVLMLAYMNKDAYEATLKSGKMTYFSRSRQSLWVKGETSGHIQYVKSLTADCDMDTILAKVSQVGAACHTGNRSCFFNEIARKEYQEENPLKIFESVLAVIQDRKVHPKEGSYTNYLFDKGVDKILKKLGEEATEIVIAAKNPNPNEIKYEISDFLYHMMVLMVEKGVTWEEISTELAQR